MAPGPLRRAIEDLFKTNFVADNLEGEPDTFKGRLDKYYHKFQEWKNSKPITELEFGEVINLHIYGFLYAISGRPFFPKWFWDVPVTQIKIDISDEIAKTMKSLFDSPVTREIAESLGSVSIGPVIDILSDYANDESKNPEDFAKAFVGTITALNLTGGIASTVVEALSAGTIKGAGKMIDQLYWSMGLGFLGWQALSPFLESSFQPRLERHFKNKNRPARFGAADLRDLYALGEISIDKLTEEAGFQGWRDQDIQQWIKLAFRTLSQGDVFDAMHQGHISEEQAVKRLRALGYDPADIPLLFKLNPKKETDEARNFSVSNARNAFSEGLITEGELRKILETLKYSKQEIDIIVQLELLSKESKDRLLSAGDIKAAWIENILTDQEARHWLETAGFASEQLDILINTWKQEIIPDYRKLNAGTIEGAYVEGILNKAQTREKLVSVGFDPVDADLELSLVEARNPEAFGRPAPVTPRKLTPGILAELVYVGLITPLQMKTRLVALGYSETDAGLLSEAARIATVPAARLLPQRTVEDAFFAAVLTRQEGLDLLAELGFSTRDSGIILDTIQAQLDAITEFKEEAQRKRLSPGALEDLVIAGLMTQDEMNARLVENGFSLIDAGLLSSRAAQLAIEPVRVLTQATVERAYIVGVLTRDQALQKLITLDFSPEESAEIVVTVERENPGVFNPGVIQSTRLPSIGALVAALQKGIITEGQYAAKAAELGYSPEDAALYLAISVRAERKGTKTLSVSQWTNAYGAGFIPFQAALGHITQQGYSDGDATLILRIEKDLIQNTDVWNALLSGALEPFDAIAQLVNMRYSDNDILDAFASLGTQTLASMGIDLRQLADALKLTPGGE